MDIATYANIGNRALLPYKIGIEWGVWWNWDLDETEWTIAYLQGQEYSWRPLRNSVAMIAWRMESIVWRFNLISPEQFLEHPVFILPPEWITLDRWQEWRGRVREIQLIIEQIVQKNKLWPREPCISAIVHDRKIDSVKHHLEGAGYEEVQKFWENHLFVHVKTIHVAQQVKTALGLI
jgi:hypothetical protein